MPTLTRKHIGGGGIPGLGKLLEAWIAAQRAYIKKMDQDDCPWWYNEVAVTGFLAGAAWRLNGIALQEYRTSKGRLKKDRWMGRCDLYTYVGKDAFIFEAKHYRTNIGRSIDNSLKHIRTRMDQAASDAKHHSSTDGTRLGICFIAPFFPAERLLEADKIIADWRDHVLTIKHSAVAWYFPKAVEGWRHGGSFVFPGMVALLRRV